VRTMIVRQTKPNNSKQRPTVIGPNPPPPRASPPGAFGFLTFPATPASWGTALRNRGYIEAIKAFHCAGL